MLLVVFLNLILRNTWRRSESIHLPLVFSGQCKCLSQNQWCFWNKSNKKSTIATHTLQLLKATFEDSEIEDEILFAVFRFSSNMGLLRSIPIIRPSFQCFCAPLQTGSQFPWFFALLTLVKLICKESGKIWKNVLQYGTVTCCKMQSFSKCFMTLCSVPFENPTARRNWRPQPPLCLREDSKTSRGRGKKVPARPPIQTN